MPTSQQKEQPRLPTSQQKEQPRLPTSQQKEQPRLPASQQKGQPRMPQQPPSAGATTPGAGATSHTGAGATSHTGAGATSHTSRRGDLAGDPSEYSSESEDSTKTGAIPAPVDECWKHHYDGKHRRWHGRGQRVGPREGGSNTVKGQHTRANQADKLRKLRRKEERKREDADDPAGAAARQQKRVETRAYDEALGAARQSLVVAQRLEMALEASAVTAARAADETARAAAATTRVADETARAAARTTRAAAKAAEEVQTKAAKLQEIDPRGPEAYQEMGASSSSAWNRHQGWVGAHHQEWSWQERRVPRQGWDWQEGLARDGSGGYIAPGKWWL